MTADSLAIIIPAYRAQFLAASLESILAQTDQQFNLYVFDDASPEPVRSLVEKFQSHRKIVYHRFEENFGARSLTQQWARCVEATTEPWVWLFSDDDEMQPDCVASLRREIEATAGRYDLYRFNTRCLNEQSQVVAENEPYPLEESGRDFLLVRLRGERGSTMQELIFSRQAWKAAGGFPDFPMAWAADDAFIASLGRQKPIRHIAGPRVHWRLSEGNITGQKSTALLGRKIQACREYIVWVNRYFLADRPGGAQLAQSELDALTEGWFFRGLYYRRKWVDWPTCRQADAFAASVWNRPRGYGAAKCLRLNLNWFLGAIWRRISRARS